MCVRRHTDVRKDLAPSDDRVGRAARWTEFGIATKVSAVSVVHKTSPSSLYNLNRYPWARGTLDQMSRSTRSTDPRGAIGSGAATVVSVGSRSPGVEP